MGLLKLNIQAGGNKVFNFKGVLWTLYDDACGYIIDWKIKLSSGTIDCLTTEAWSKPKNQQNKDWNKRTKILESIGLINKIRADKKNHDLVKLKLEQIDTINKYFNSKEYKSTIYNLCKFFKGSNPSGAYQTPENGQIWECDSGKNYKINIFFKYFTNKKIKSAIRGTEENKEEWETANNLPEKEIDNINSYLNRFQEVPDEKRSIKYVFEKLQEPKTKGDKNYKSFQNDIKRISNHIMKEYNKIEDDVSKQRRDYLKNIEQKYGKEMIQIANKIWNKEFQDYKFDCAHILPVSFIKKEMIKNLNKPEYENLKMKISDPCNFLPLDKQSHSFYDDTLVKFYWSPKDGKLIKLDKQIKSKDWYIDLYSSIDNFELKDRIKYLQEYKELKGL